MEKIDFKKLANQLMFDLNEEELATISEDFDLLLQQLELLNEIDTDGVEEMVYPFETPTSYLREDVVDHVLTTEAALYNAKEVKDDMIVVARVVR